MSRLYVGNVSSRIVGQDLDDLFWRYGRLRQIELKQGYAFVEFDHPRDAEDAMRREDGRMVDGQRIRIEIARAPRERESHNRCFNCGGEGHWSRDCTAPRQPDQGGRRGGGGFSGTCYTCHQEGHRASECPQTGRDRSYGTGPPPPQHHHDDDRYGAGAAGGPGGDGGGRDDYHHHRGRDDDRGPPPADDRHHHEQRGRSRERSRSRSPPRQRSRSRSRERSPPPRERSPLPPRDRSPPRDHSPPRGGDAGGDRSPPPRD